MLVELRFFSLQSRTQIFQIDHADSLLEFNMDTEQFWVLQVKKDAKVQTYRDVVSLIQWDRKKHVSTDEDVLKSYITETNDSDIFTYRRAGLQ